MMTLFPIPPAYSYTRRFVHPVYGTVRRRTAQHHPQRHAYPTVAAHASHDRPSPTIRASETADHLILQIDCPGLKAADLAQWDVKVSRDQVWLRGSLPKATLENNPQAALAIDFASGLFGLVGSADLKPTMTYVDRPFERQISLPYAVQHTQVKAAVQDGQLTLTLPKCPNDRPVTVKVGIASTRNAAQPAEQPREPEMAAAPEMTPETPTAVVESGTATGSSNPTAISLVVEEAIPDPWSN